MEKFDFKYLEQDFESIRQQIKTELASGDFADYNPDAPALASFVELLTESSDILSFYLNLAAKEGHLATTQFYENILSRAGDELSYLPNGFVPPVVDINFSVVYTASGSNNDELWYSGATLRIPRYTNIKTNKGNYYYSFAEDVTLPLDVKHLDQNYNDPANDVYTGLWTFENIRLIEGIYKNYIIGNPATEPITEITIPKISGKNIAHGYIDVYVATEDEAEEVSYTQWKRVDNLKAYSSTDEVFELRLTDTLGYIVKFGDGTHGKAIATGDRAVQTFVLYSKETDGEIDAEALTNSKIINSVGTGWDEVIEFSPRHAHYLEEYVSEYNPSLNTYNPNNNDDLKKLTEKYIKRYEAGIEDLDPTWYITIEQTNHSSKAIDYETVEQIKTNAAEVFSYQGLLMTNKDVLSYIRAKWFTIFYDAYIMNNWEYMTTYASDLIEIEDIEYYRDNIRSSRDIVEQTDSCDFNNVYIVGVPHAGLKIDPRDINRVVADINDQNLKTFNNDMVVIQPIWKYLGMNIEVIKDTGVKIKSVKSDQEIIIEIHNALINYFRQDRMKLGQEILKSDIKQIIFSVGGVDSITKLNVYLKPIEDFTVTNGTEGNEIGYGVQMMPYEFPLWSQTFNNTLHKANSYIKVISNTDEYNGV